MQPNVCLVVLNVVCAANVSCYGYQRQTTSNISDLTVESERTERLASKLNGLLDSFGISATSELQLDIDSGTTEQLGTSAISNLVVAPKSRDLTCFHEVAGIPLKQTVAPSEDDAHRMVG